MKVLNLKLIHKKYFLNLFIFICLIFIFIFILIVNSQGYGSGGTQKCSNGATDYPTCNICPNNQKIFVDGGQCLKYKICDVTVTPDNGEDCPVKTQLPPPDSTINQAKNTFSNTTRPDNCATKVTYEINVVSNNNNPALKDYPISLCGTDEDAGDTLTFWGSDTLDGNYSQLTTNLSSPLPLTDGKVEATAKHNWNAIVANTLPSTPTTYSYYIYAKDQDGISSPKVTYELKITPLIPTISTEK